MIHVRRWDPTTNHCSIEAEALPATAAEISGDAMIWIDLDNPTVQEETRVFEQFLPIHPLTFADVTKPRRDPTEGAHHPKVEEFPGYLFVIVNPLPPSIAEATAKTMVNIPRETRKQQRANRPQLSAIITHNVLITHHYTNLRSVASVCDYTTRHGECTRRGPDYIFHLILDQMVDEYAPVVDRIAERLDKLETVMFRSPTPAVLAQLLRLKRRVSYLRKTLILEREVLARLSRGEFEFVDERERVYYRNVFDHLVRYTELIEGGREMVGDLMQSYLSATSNRMNRIMKSLAVISTIILPMNLVAGIYGMNFKNMPELEWEYGYPMALAIMCVLGSASIYIFRRRRWL